jgi:LPXTG-motif cell wall-anchored protein
MAYGNPTVTPAIVATVVPTVLPTTGSNDNLFVLAASMLALGVVVYLVTLFLTRKSVQVSEL